MEELDLRDFTTPKHFRSAVELEGSTFEIEVCTPDLSGGERAVWGDWGPMYTFTFDGPRQVVIRYRCRDLAIEGELDLWVQSIQLNSPMRFSRRQKYPLCLEFGDPSRGLAFEGYLDVKGEPAVLELKQTPLRDNVASLLLLQPPRMRDRGMHALVRDVA